MKWRAWAGLMLRVTVRSLYVAGMHAGASTEVHESGRGRAGTRKEWSRARACRAARRLGAARGQGKGRPAGRGQGAGAHDHEGAEGRAGAASAACATVCGPPLGADLGGLSPFVFVECVRRFVWDVYCVFASYQVSSFYCHHSTGSHIDVVAATWSIEPAEVNAMFTCRDGRLFTCWALRSTAPNLTRRSLASAAQCSAYARLSAR